VKPSFFVFYEQMFQYRTVIASIFPSSALFGPALRKRWPVGAGEVRVIISSSVKLPHCLGTLFSVTLTGGPLRFFKNLRSRAPHMHLSPLFGHSAAG
jgi:hypothetical protein